jgi:LacI family transcriptional regulator
MAKRTKRPLPNIAVLVEPSRSYGRNVLRGIADYARIHGPWIFHFSVDAPLRSVPSRDLWDGDGIIAQPHQNKELLEQLRASGMPVVSLSGPPGFSGFPSVRPNQEAVPKLALDHFRQRGFVRFAYVGSPSERFWPRTGEMFKGMCEEAGYTCETYEASYDSALHSPHKLAPMSEWLKSLKKPIALLAGNDARAREVLDACRLANLHVPEAVAVLGVNDDELICELANPPLSSIIHNARRVGHEAAAILDRMMNGEKVKDDVVIDPVGVKSRQSTDLLAIEDPEIATAVRFIRENACSGIRVDDVLDQIPLSRRAMETRFRNAVGRPPHMEIRRVQLERVKELLVGSDYKLEKIADMTGFSSAQYLAGLFHRVVGMTPGSWRSNGRSRGTAAAAASAAH